jgi:hypothetical protein
MLDAPTFNVPLGSEISGDDPLGLAPVNERLYGSVLPGINNVVRYVRIYALLCWATRRTEEYVKKNSGGLTTKDVTGIFNGMREKIELLVTWANLDIKARGGLVGTQRKFPEDERSVSLTFEFFGTNEAAYMSAVQYRPSVTNGLGFLEARAHGTFACTEVGVELAQAMDEALRSNPHYKWLGNVRVRMVRRAQVTELKKALDLEKPRRAEQDVFLSRLVPAKAEAEDVSLDANRRAGMVLALRAVAAANAMNRRRKRARVGASEREIRTAMARGCAADGTVLDLAGIEKAQAKWAVLQLRQYQRACVEAFYVGLEYVLSGEVALQDRSINGVAEYMGVLAEETFTRGVRLIVGDLEKEIRSLQGSHASLYQAALAKPEADVFQLREDLLDSELDVLEGSGMPLLGEAVSGLVFCAVEARNLATEERMRSYLALDPDKLPLAALPPLINQYRSHPVRELVAHMVRIEVIDRHYQVVAMRSRSADEKNRFRFVETEDGLRRFDESRDLPLITEAQDRLARALDLLEQCDILERDEGGYVLMGRGSVLLARN